MGFGTVPNLVRYDYGVLNYTNPNRTHIVSTYTGYSSRSGPFIYMTPERAREMALSDLDMIRRINPDQRYRLTIEHQYWR